MTKVLILAPQTEEVIRAPVWIGSILTGKALNESRQLCGLRRVRAFFERRLLQEQKLTCLRSKKACMCLGGQGRQYNQSAPQPLDCGVPGLDHITQSEQSYMAP